MKRTEEKKSNHKMMGLSNHKQEKRAQNKGSRQDAKRQIDEYKRKY